MNYLPNASSEDVHRILERDFNPADHQAVLRLLDEYGTVSGREAARVHLAILKLSGKSVEGVREQVDVAKRDFRDVIAPAEYPEFWRTGFVGVDEMTQDERESLKARDWQQYVTWLTRE